MDVTAISRQNDAFSASNYTEAGTHVGSSVYWLRWSMCQRICRCISRSPTSRRKIIVKGVTYADFDLMFESFDLLPVCSERRAEQLNLRVADVASRVLSEAPRRSRLTPRKGGLAKRSGARTRQRAVASRARAQHQRKTRSGAIKLERRGCWHGPRLDSFLQLERFKRQRAKCYKSGAVFGAGTISFISFISTTFKYAGSVPTVVLEFGTCLFHNPTTPIRLPVDSSISYTPTRIQSMATSVAKYHADSLADGLAIPFESELCLALANDADARTENGRRVFTTANGSTFYMDKQQVPFVYKKSERRINMYMPIF